jgi:hypothetical protein
MQTGNVIDLQFIEDRLYDLEGRVEDPDATIHRDTIEIRPMDTTSIAPSNVSRASRARSAFSRDG